MSARKVLYISDEIFPFVGESPMANYCRQLPQSVQELGHEIRIFMPKWGPINERRNQLHEVIRLSGMNLIIDDTDHPLIIKVASLPAARIQAYFIDNDDYFQNRQFVCDKAGKEYEDNDERTIFFARGVLETVKKLRWNPDVIHCHGWLSALIPLFVKTAYRDEPAFRESKVVYSVYDKSFSSDFRKSFPEVILTKDMKVEDIGVFSDPIDFSSIMRKAIDFSDGVIANAVDTDSELVKYAHSKSVPVLGFSEEALKPENVCLFYDSLF